MKPGGEKTLRLYTIGHSNYSFEEFLSLLKTFEICAVADIRRYSGSCKFPHFDGEALHKLLDKEGICYVWLEALGGRRHRGESAKSSNIGIRSLGFRNYADHMATDEFRATVQKLLSTAATSRTAIMCAERFYWKCHRRLLSDYLVAQGVEVTHILGHDKFSEHKLTPSAVVSAGRMITYPSATSGKVDTEELFSLGTEGGPG
jgi:uncharacterized protein (DUF488 family)